MTYRIGSLCTGYGGLDMAVESVLGGEHAWVADNDAGASKILAHRFPLVPNLGDITAVDWAAVEPVDILTAGFPCQDISCAGKRAGLREGTRSGLWSHVARAIAALRPPLVVIENVKELLSERADSDVEQCPWCLGDTDSESAVRALGAVLADLAEVGFDAEWVSVPAAAAGACHLRWRVFVLAWPAANTARDKPRWHAAVAGDAGRETGHRPGPAIGALLPTPRASARENRQTKRTPSQEAGTHGLCLAAEVLELLPTPTTSYSQRKPEDWRAGRPAANGATRDRIGDPEVAVKAELLPTPRATDGTSGAGRSRRLRLAASRWRTCCQHRARRIPTGTTAAAGNGRRNCCSLVSPRSFRPL